MESMDPLALTASHVGQVGVYLTPESERPVAADQIIEELRDKLLKSKSENGIESLNFVKQKVGPPVGKPVAIGILMKILAPMEKAAKQVMTKLRDIPGVGDENNFTKGKEEGKNFY